MYKNRRRIFILHQNTTHDALKKNGGDEEDRTPDLLNANQALSQLSYVPILWVKIMVGLARLELATPRLSSVCSNQLSYKPSADQ